jgi:membrane-associated phospholipid phosphatase
MLALCARVTFAQPADTTRVSVSPLFTRSDAVIAGVFALATVAAAPLDRHFADRMQNIASKESRFLKDAADFFNFMGSPGPVLIGPAMYGAGRLFGNKEMADLGLHGTEAVMVGTVIITVGKGVAGRARPYQSPDDPRNFKLNRGWKHEAYRSFPSGHAVAGFAAASAVTAETSRFWPHSTWIVGPMMYGGAGLIAATRMYANKHWASDVIVGAAIGTFSGLKVVKYNHSHPSNKLDKWLLSASIQPAPGGGLALGWSVVPGK